MAISIAHASSVATTLALGTRARRSGHQCRLPHRRRGARGNARASVEADGDGPSSSETSTERSQAQRVLGGTFAVGETIDSGGGTMLVIRSVLGRGSFGTTYSAEQPDGAMVAVKVLALREMRSWKSLELFEREAKTLRALSHPAIPDYIDYFQIETSGDVKYCLVQRIAPGDTLQSLVDDGWRPTEAEVESVAVQLLEVLGYLGSLRPPVAHRDVKPGNVLLERLSGRVSLVDFGATADAGVTAAMAEDAAAVRAAGSGDGFGSGFVAGSTMVGTFGYCAPEQMLGLVTPASDLYSAGATLLFLLSGRAPATMPQSRLKINFRGIVTIENARLEALVGRLLEPAAEDRFQTAAEAFRALTAPVAPRGGGGAMGGRNFRGGGDEKGEGGGEGVSSSISERRPWDDVDLDLAGLAGDGGGVTVPGIFPYPGAGGGDGIQQQRSDSGGSRAVEEDRTRPWRRIRQPAGTRVVVEREGKTKLLIVIPPQGVTMASAGTGAFALAWNGFIAFWTASALAAGGGLVMAAFTIPFWLAGSSVAKTAFEQVFEASRLEVDAFQFSQTTTATGLVSKTTAGEVDDLQGVRLVVESTSNDEPNVCLELEYGATPVRFGRGLTPIELEFVAAEVNAFIHELST